MKTSQFRDYSELPLFLNAETVSKILGISSANSYELMHEPNFPVLKIGNRMVVPHPLGRGKYCWGQDFMRKNGLLIGMPMRDSKRYRFAISNKIWDHKLKPIAFMLFS